MPTGAGGEATGRRPQACPPRVNSETSGRGSGPRSDTHLHDVTIQIYRTDLREDPSSAPIHFDIPTVAIYLPKQMARNWLVEDRAVID